MKTEKPLQQRHLYLERPDIVERLTRVVAARLLENGLLAIALEENIHRAAGGGEPADRGHTELVDSDCIWPIRAVVKNEGQTWLHVEAAGFGVPLPGTPMRAYVEAEYRSAKSRLHTLEHMTVAIALRRHPDARLVTTQISEDAQSARIEFVSREAVALNSFFDVDREVRSAVLAAHKVSYAKASSIEAARDVYAPLFRVNERHSFSGKVRLVIIDQVDVNPCGGTHHFTSDVGPYQMDSRHIDGDVRRLLLTLTLTPSWTYWYGDRIDQR